MRTLRSSLLGLAFFAALAPLQSADAAFIRRNVIKKSPVTGYRVMVEVGDDEADEVDSVRVELSPSEEGGPAPSTGAAMLLRLKVRPNGNKRYVFNRLDFGEDPGDAPMEMAITLFNERGDPVGETELRRVTVDGPPTPNAGSLTISQSDRVNFDVELGLFGDPTSAVATIAMVFVEGSGSPPLVDELILRGGAPVSGRRSFRATGLSFENPIEALDEAYDVMLDLRDAEGFSLGTQDLTVVVQGMSAR